MANRITHIQIAGDKREIGLADNVKAEILADIETAPQVSTTHAELLALRDAAQLTPGMAYRITDYLTTTLQADTRSAGHPFDIIVLATAANALSETARAALHDGDEYFAAANINAWQLLYCLDNDTTRFAWADTENGKGVIFRMIDDRQNDIPYDFKNILFLNTIEGYDATTADGYYFTFSVVQDGVLYDHTIAPQSIGMCRDNRMAAYGGEAFDKQYLNANVFRCTDFAMPCFSNTFGFMCHSNTFGFMCISNTFGVMCSSNTFGDVCSYNTFGDECSSNTFGKMCSSNTFGDGCYSNTFGDGCFSNTFGNQISGLADFAESNITLTTATLYQKDSSGKNLPVRHPDITTSANILPYKFSGKYVYEKIVALTDGAAPAPSSLFAHIATTSDALSKVFIIEAHLIAYGTTGAQCSPAAVQLNPTADTLTLTDIPGLTYTLDGQNYLRIIYTTHS